MQEPDMVGTEEQTEDAETEDDLKTSDTDQDEDLSICGPSAVATRFNWLLCRFLEFQLVSIFLNFWWFD